MTPGPWHTPRTWTLGELGTGPELNETRDNLSALITKCRALQTISHVVGAGGTYTPVFDSVTTDPYGMWSAGAPTRVTVPFSGTYRIEAFCNGLAGTGAPPSLSINLNGAFLLLGLHLLADSSGQWVCLAGPWEIPMSAGDYLELSVVASGAGAFTLSPGSLSTVVLAAGSSCAQLSAEFVGP